MRVRCGQAPQTFPIRDVFRRLYQQFGGDAETRGLAFRFRATRRIVRTDPLLLERVLANLVQNALRYTRHGGVLVAARRHLHGVALEVWDTGLGIPDDKQDMIFREFYQIDNPERDRGRGLGMGLAIVRRLCHLLDHPLELRSSWVGAVCSASSCPQATAMRSIRLSAEADTLPPRRTGTITVLLIDDDRTIRDATRELLVPMQVKVLTAATIAEAVNACRQLERTDRPGHLRLAAARSRKWHRCGERRARSRRILDPCRADHGGHLTRAAEVRARERSGGTAQAAAASPARAADQAFAALSLGSCLEKTAWKSM